ncbi:hypothetical protein THIOKS1920010 [Thiocapsa sp. KS1]|nr:hypothetical protein THIOKS1920010 [Thiocapsa sp. KS1]
MCWVRYALPDLRVWNFSEINEADLSQVKTEKSFSDPKPRPPLRVVDAPNVELTRK